jgi:molybdopterin synthase sulfur carrier subunit
MTVKLLFFAGLREALGTGAETLDLPDGVATVGDLRDVLAARGEPWPALAATKNLRVAVNQQMVGFDAAIKAGDEVAFFPPVTGGWMSVQRAGSGFRRRRRDCSTLGRARRRGRRGQLSSAWCAPTRRAARPAASP